MQGAQRCLSLAQHDFVRLLPRLAHRPQADVQAVRPVVLDVDARYVQVLHTAVNLELRSRGDALRAWASVGHHLVVVTQGHAHGHELCKIAHVRREIGAVGTATARRRGALPRLNAHLLAVPHIEHKELDPEPRHLPVDALQDCK